MLFNAISAAAMALLAVVEAAPAQLLPKRGFSCASLAPGLSAASCSYMSSIGMFGQGLNSHSSSAGIWVGSDGPNKFTFQNRAGGEDLIVIIWNFASGDYQSSFMNVRAPKISYTLKAKQNITISMANDVSGGWAGLYTGQTTLTPYGQINNVWGEFTTGAWGTVDVSRLVNMAGNDMKIALDTGCVSDMDQCVFKCKSGNTCWESGSYNLVDCAPGSQPGATYGVLAGNPEGGCQGFANGGHMNVTFYE